MKISQNARKAIYIGTLFSIAYLVVYIARNALSAVTPQMLAEGYTEAYIGSISSLYFTCYAVGQLINGFIGDKIRAKWMMCLGLLFAGATNLALNVFPLSPTLAMITYGATGFFLSMIYAPMTKVVSENTEPLHAVRCSLGYTFSSSIGSPAAGLLAAGLVWQSVFAVSSGLLAVTAIAVFFFITLFERRGMVRHGQYQPQGKNRFDFRVLVRHRIIKFTLVSILTGVVRTSVVFWLPTYINQYLGYDASTSATIFTVATLLISASAFIAVFIYERLHQNMDLSLLLMFGGATAFFLLTYLVKLPMINIVFIVLAITSSNAATSILWGIYCPSLRDTGMVSTATGFLDFVSYMAAAVANLVFSNAVSAIGWGNLILIWIALMLVGTVASLPFGRMKKATE
ncbi:MAG: MFS transporter [Clostridia bacterium]|nr:MFS transporter [Clostridia bacterium]